MQAHAKNEVIVLAGLIQSAMLLMRSGIGRKAHLEERKIKCKSDVPVGDNCIYQIYLNLLAKFDGPITGTVSPSATLDSFCQYDVDKSGPLKSVPHNGRSHSSIQQPSKKSALNYCTFQSQNQYQHQSDEYWTYYVPYAGGNSKQIHLSFWS